VKNKIARIFFISAGVGIPASCILLFLKIQPVYTFFYLFIWWSYILLLDSWIYLQTGTSIWIDRPIELAAFLIPFSAFIWFIFEALNLRLHDWVYIGVPRTVWVRWAGNFLAFGTVLPGMMVTENFLETWGVFRKNEFSLFFQDDWSPRAALAWMFLGLLMILLPMIFPKFFFPLVWGGFVFLLDPVNAHWKGKSLLREWRQKNWNRTFQTLASGLICGGLWEFWNFWAGAKWIYTVPLSDFFMGKLKIFEMPVLGFLGFPLFALECFVLLEFAKNVRERASKKQWGFLSAACILFMMVMCALMDRHTVRAFR